MEIKRLDFDFTVCKLKDYKDIDLSHDYYFLAQTDEEISLVCRTDDTPKDVLVVDDGWKSFRIQGILDFSLIGILSKISTILANEKIGIFAISTYNTDYILVKKENFERALKALKDSGYTLV